jgi:endonuclease-8
VLETADWVAVGFSLGITEIVPTALEHTVIGHLGPDLLGVDWNADAVAERLSADPHAAIFVALLDQRNLAGLGNVFVNELCFLRGMLPEREVANTDVTATIALAHKLIVANRDRAERTTTGDTRAGRRTWVYGRKGMPCRRCGTRIRSGSLGPTPLQLRVTYWCPRCQV